MTLSTITIGGDVFTNVAEIRDADSPIYRQRFPDSTSTNCGFVFAIHQGVHRISYVRWVHTKSKYNNSWDNNEGVLRYSLPTTVTKYTDQAIANSVNSTINVLLLTGKHKYDMGTFRVDGVTNETPRRRVVLHRVSKAPDVTTGWW